MSRHYHRHSRSHSSPAPSFLSLLPAVTSSQRSQRFLALLLGLWLGGLLVVALGVPAVFRAIEMVKQNPNPAMQMALRTAAPETIDLVLRYQASEALRTLLEAWGWMQTGVSAVIFGFLLFGTSSRRIPLGISLGMLALAVFMSLSLIPRLQAISRDADFVQLEANPASYNPFTTLGQGFLAFESTIALLALALLALLLAGGGAARQRNAAAGEQIDVVDHADHRGVNG